MDLGLKNDCLYKEHIKNYYTFLPLVKMLCHFNFIAEEIVSFSHLNPRMSMFQ